MSLSVTLPTETPANIHTTIVPWWGAWSAFLIVLSFYLTQCIGIFMVQMMVGFNVGLDKGVNGIDDLDQTWLLLATIGAAMVAWQVASSRAKPSMNWEWFSEFLGSSYSRWSPLRFALLGVGLAGGFSC